MNRLAWAAAAVVIFNLVVNSLHGASHERTHVGLTAWQLAFVVTTVYVLPIAAAALYWTPLRQTGAMLLAASLVAAVLFGVYFHFIADTSDHVSHQHADADGRMFVATA